MDKPQVNFSIEEKKALLQELFESVVNPDKGRSTRKCVMQDWYNIRPGLCANVETIFYGLREHDGALCVFTALPYGTDSDNEFHVFDKYPFVAIVPKSDAGGFMIKMRDRVTHSYYVNDEIKVLEEIFQLYTEFSKRYRGIITNKKLVK